MKQLQKAKDDYYGGFLMLSVNTCNKISHDYVEYTTFLLQYIFPVPTNITRCLFGNRIYYMHNLGYIAYNG